MQLATMSILHGASAWYLMLPRAGLMKQFCVALLRFDLIYFLVADYLDYFAVNSSIQTAVITGLWIGQKYFLIRLQYICIECISNNIIVRIRTKTMKLQSIERILFFDVPLNFYITYFILLLTQAVLWCYN